MNSINTNFNNNYGLNQHQIRFKADPQAVALQQDVQLPDMFYMPDYANKPKSFKETIKKYDLMGLIYNWFEHPFLMLGTCLGISYGVGKAEKSFGREYAESSLGKAAALGDKLEQSAFVQNEKTQKVLGGIKNFWDKTVAFLKKNSVIKAMIETPSQPEWSMPKGEMKHSEANIIDKFKGFIQEYNLEGKEKEEGIGLFEGIKKPFKKLFKTEEKDFTEILKGLGKSDAEIDAILKSGNAKETVSQELRKAFGFTEDALKDIMKDEAGETAKSVKEYCGKVKNIPKFNEIYNRLHSIEVGGGAKTETGRFFSKMLQKLYRGFTFGNSKYGVMFWVAPFLVNTFVNTHKADKKEKVGTFVDGLIQSVSWVFVFPLVLMGIHAIGGAQNAGMGEKVTEVRKRIEAFNKRVLNKEFKTKDHYDRARKGLDLRIKALKRVKNQSLLTKIIRKISAFTKADLMKIEPYNNGSAFSNFMRKIPNFLKDAAYAPARFAVFMLVGMPLVDKLIGKCTSAIFGKPYDEFKEAEAEENKKAQEEFTMNDLNERMLEVQRKKLNPEENTQQNPLNEENKAAMAELAAAAAATGAGAGVGVNNVGKGVNSEIAKQQVQAKTTEQALEQQKTPQEQVQERTQAKPDKQRTEQVKQQAAQTAQVGQNYVQRRDNYTYIPSQENILNTIVPQEQINKYIPSQLGAKFTKTFDNSGLDAAIKRANNAEKRALDVLSGNFSTRY